MAREKNKLTEQEETLLKDFSKDVSKKSSAFFYFIAFVASISPLWLFIQINHMDAYQNGIVFAGVVIVSTWLLSFAYKNTKFVLKHKIAIQREEGVSREMMKKLADDKKITKDERDERVLWQKNDVAEYEASNFSIFYNNVLFIAVLIFVSFFVLRSFNTTVNYALSMLIASSLPALFSTGTVHN